MMWQNNIFKVQGRTEVKDGNRIFSSCDEVRISLDRERGLVKGLEKTSLGGKERKLKIEEGREGDRKEESATWDTLSESWCVIKEILS